MRFVSWNVNGLRACIQKGFLDFFNSADADFFCLQETKLQDGQLDLDLQGYTQYWNYAEKKGYSGTAVFARTPAVTVKYGMGIPELDTEGRLITLEYPNFYLVTCYTPNAQRELARLPHRLKWEAAFSDYLVTLKTCKSVIVCGDLNVAHKEIDLKNPASNRSVPVFLTKNVHVSLRCSTKALQTLSAICTRIPPVHIAGGVTCLKHGRTMQVGVSTIF